MRNNIFNRLKNSLIICLIIVSFIVNCIVLSTFNNVLIVYGDNKPYTVSDVQNIYDGIIGFKLNKSGFSSVQNWIDMELSKNAGVTSEWYILGLSQNGKYNFKKYESGLNNYLKNNTVYSASSRQKYALSYIAIGSNNEYISTVLNDSIGKQGIMSYVYGLHLLNNGYKSNVENITSVKDKILSLQLSDGGFAVMGNVSDNDVTAMTIQSLAPFYKSDSNVKNAIDKAVTLLSERQLVDGDYSNYGVPNSESTAQVMTALCSIGINPEMDERFIKNGNSLIDGLKKYKLADGSFTHKENGGFDENATSQVFYSLVAFFRMSNNKSGLYILDNRNPNALNNNSSSVTVPNEQHTTQIVPTDNVNNNDDKNKQESTAKEEINHNISETEELQTSRNEDSSSTASEKITSDSNSSEKESESNTETTEQETNVENSEMPNSNNNNTTEDETVSDIESSEKTTDGQFNNSDVKDKKVENKKNSNYKIGVSIVTVIISGIVGVILFLKKKFNKKNLIVLIGVTIFLICFVIFTDFQSKDSYYNGKDTLKENIIGSVTFSIRCDKAIGKTESEYIPSDGVILENTDFKIEKNDTVYDILVEAARKYKIQIDNTGNDNMAYIAGINYLYEFECGELSGWTYKVNGEIPSVGCDKYELKAGDKIEWIYTLELGKDIE